MMPDITDYGEGPEALKVRLTEIVELLVKQANELIEKYNYLRSNAPLEDSVMTRICKKIFDESEKDGEHRRLLFSFYKSATETHNLMRDMSLDDPNARLRLLAFVITSLSKYEALRASASKHLERMKKEMKLQEE